MTQKQPTDKAVVSLSGGMDSATLATWAAKKYGPENVYAVGFHYGQRHNAELMKAVKVSERLGIHFDLIELPKIFAGAGSSLMADQDVEVIGSYESLAARFGSQPTVVPNRNMNFIAMMTTYALTHGAGHVMLGAHAGDAANYHYPDCRPAFNGALAAAIDIATEGAVLLEAPFNYMTKGEIVKLAADLHAPLEMTLSCYNGKDPACGGCATCLERINAFIEAGYIDPIPYAIDFNWPNCKPFPV